MKKIVLVAATIWMMPSFAQATVIPELLTEYTAEGAGNFSDEAGKAMWNKEFVAEDGTKRSCTTCHHADVTQPGKHQKTGKVIAPMALSVPFVALEEGDEPRYSDAKKVEKWFKRNCKWTYGRECTIQEKGDFLTFLKDQ